MLVEFIVVQAAWCPKETCVMVHPNQHSSSGFPSGSDLVNEYVSG